jgi:hypothetical protein
MTNVCQSVKPLDAFFYFDKLLQISGHADIIKVNKNSCYTETEI